MTAIGIVVCCICRAYWLNRTLEMGLFGVSRRVFRANGRYFRVSDRRVLRTLLFHGVWVTLSTQPPDTKVYEGSIGCQWQWVSGRKNRVSDQL